jgi:hypothetical protein
MPAVGAKKFPPVGRIAMNGFSMISCYIRIFPQCFPNHLSLISIGHYSMHPNREQQYDVGADARKDPVALITDFLYYSKSPMLTTRMLDYSANTAIVYATSDRWRVMSNFLSTRFSCGHFSEFVLIQI